MSEEPAPERIAVIWSREARADLRAIDREIAMQVLRCIDGYLASRGGDVKKLKPPLTGLPAPVRRLPGVLRSQGREHYRYHRRPEPPGSLPLKNSPCLLQFTRNGGNLDDCILARPSYALEKR